VRKNRFYHKVGFGGRASREQNGDLPVEVDSTYATRGHNRAENGGY